MQRQADPHSEILLAGDVADFVRGVLTSDSVLDASMRAELLTPSGVGSPPSIYGLGIEIVAGPTLGSFGYQHAGKNPGARADYLHMTSSSESITIAWCASAAFGDYDAWYEGFVLSVLEVLDDADLLPEA